MKVVIDTSVFIDYVRVGKGLLSELIELNKKRKLILYVPTPVIVELWAGLSMSVQDNEMAMRLLLRPTKIIPLTRQLAEEAGVLRRERKVIEFADSVVAATTLYLDAQLATRNKKHFEKVKRLRLFEVSKS